MRKIFKWDEIIQCSDTTWQDYFETLNNGEEFIKDLIKNTDDLSKMPSEDLVQANEQARQSAIAHNAALKQQTLGARAATVATNALATDNMLVSWGTSVAISKAIELFVSKK